MKAQVKKRLACIFLGDECSKCRTEVTDVNLPMFVFHHKDPKQKTIKISKLLSQNVSWAEIKLELRKCDLMCANCHTIGHAIHTKRGLLPI